MARGRGGRNWAYSPALSRNLKQTELSSRRNAGSSRSLQCMPANTFFNPTAETAAATALTTQRPQITLRSFGRRGNSAKNTNGSVGMQNRIKLLRAQIK